MNFNKGKMFLRWMFYFDEEAIERKNEITKKGRLFIKTRSSMNF